KFIGIIDRCHHAWNYRRGFLGGPSRRASVGDEHVHLLSYEVSGECAQIRVALCRSRLNVDGTPFNIIKAAQTCAKCVEQRVRAGCRRQPTEQRNFVGLSTGALLRIEEKRSDATSE